jgi:hypothetical protein
MFAVSFGYGNAVNSGDMMRAIVALAFVAPVLALVGAPLPTQAESGQVAAGILAVRPAPPPAYYYPAPARAAPPPAYVVPPPSCYYTPGAPVWDSFRAMWVRPRVQICD